MKSKKALLTSLLIFFFLFLFPREVEAGCYSPAQWCCSADAFCEVGQMAGCGSQWCFNCGGGYGCYSACISGYCSSCDGCCARVCCPCDGPGDPCPYPTFPTTKWDRVWCDRSLSTKIGDTPDESNIQFDNNWGTDEVGGHRADNIGFRSGRTVNFPVTGTYRFTLGSDDGARLWIDDVLRIDRWYDTAYSTSSVDIALTAGNHKLRIDYYENQVYARVSFSYVILCSGCNYFDTPASGATLYAGSTYNLGGWAYFKSGPAGKGAMYAVDIHRCDQGTWNNCQYIGSAKYGGYRQDTVNACGNSTAYTGWNYSWMIPFNLTGNYTLRAAAINDSGKTCVVWSAKNISIVLPPPTCKLEAEPSSGDAPLSGTLTWTTAFSPTSCTASGDWSGSKDPSGGSETYGPLNTAGTYTFHLSCIRGSGMGTCRADVPVSWPPGGTIKGTIWKDFNNVGQSCFEDPQGDNYTESPITVSYTPCEPYDPNYYLPDGKCTKVTTTGDYQFDGVPLSGPSYGVSISKPPDPWFCTHGCNCIGVTVPDNNEANFGVTDNPLSWIQGINGDIYGNGIAAQVVKDPPGVAPEYARWFLGADPDHTAIYPGGGVVISGDPDPNNLTCGGGGTFPGRCSQRPNGTSPGWHVTGEAMGWPSLDLSKFPPSEDLVNPPWGNLQPYPNKIYRRPSMVVNVPGSYSLIADGIAVIYIKDANLRFEENFRSQSPNSKGVLFIVENGQVTIGEDVSQIDALVLVINGQITVEGDNVANNLTVRGMLYAENGFSFRTLADNRKPAVVVRYNPLYLHYPNPLAKPQVVWREVAP